MKKLLAVLLVGVLIIGCLCGCSQNDKQRQLEVAKNLERAQPTPTDIEYSLERYNLIRRTYWVNGMTEKAKALECPVQKPLGYVALFVEGIGVIDTYVVDGKVSSLNSFLTPDTTSPNSTSSSWLADVDGSYGENDNGIFFFTVDGEYKEWTGIYFYSSSPFEVEETILKTKEVE